jgi:hypothetical protein
MSKGNVVARVYTRRSSIVFRMENPVHAEHFRTEYFISKLASLSDVSEKFSTLNTSTQWNHTNIIVVTDKVKVFILKLGLGVRKLEGKSFDMFARLKDFIEDNSMETSDTETDQCVKRHQNF